MSGLRGGGGTLGYSAKFSFKENREGGGGTRFYILFISLSPPTCVNKQPAIQCAKVLLVVVLAPSRPD